MTDEAPMRPAPTLESLEAMFCQSPGTTCGSFISRIAAGKIRLGKRGKWDPPTHRCCFVMFCFYRRILYWLIQGFGFSALETESERLFFVFVVRGFEVLFLAFDTFFWVVPPVKLVSEFSSNSSYAKYRFASALTFAHV